MRHIVILGNGISGITAARELRKHTDDQITVVSDETPHFFSRTALMYVYMGHLEFQHTKPYEDWFWTKNRIDLLQVRVDTIDFSNKLIQYAGGQTLTYDVLILAVGSQPNFFDWPGQQLQGVQGLYGKPDLDRMEASTAGIRQAVVVGGGLIGIELCEMLLSRGIRVTFLVREKTFWSSVLPPEESAMVTRHIRDHHVDLRIDTEMAELRDNGAGRVDAVITKTGETIPAEFVGVAVGVSPNIGFLKETPLDTDRGILVNEYLETNLPDVYAIGDCVQHRHPPAGRKPLEQIWYTGRIMGETVAKTLLGTRTRYQPGVFFNSAKFFDIEYQTYGNVANFLPDDGPEESFYWQHATENVAIRINYRVSDQAVTGMNVLGLRQRQDVWQQWIREGKSIKHVIEHLPQANFDPEFFRQFEVDIITRYNSENRDKPVALLKGRKGLFNLFGNRR
ncbi:NAD(P)/FAD-dependent oxidoreductase [Spirosoma sordidisoli]|uniref:NAD(P)/FAD-dependent oxidoreductase n=1 Tax=Spirosoma sordidisoli TaxID=2502893 RepID=A0A4Q2UTC4_9BACT|nr:FAD-dependent oxidoreductase [Spirosoma sordidisoli]RYC71171.1 NAD(P)/FAD-dependent oxidoreductase [Spirosoma sordidisoli]